MNRAFWKAGHWPTLVAAFLYFDLAFMVWVLLGPLGVSIAKDLQLDAAQKGLMVGLPVLAGALLRPVLGASVDFFGAKITGIVAQLIVIAALAVGWLVGVTTYSQVLVLGLFLGVAGASFAVALPLASRWYPPEHQGTALGIAGAGNSGTAFAALLAPTLAAWYGWSNVFGLALIPLVLVLIVFAVIARNPPSSTGAKSWSDYVRVLREKDAWWFMFFYSVTFGGFVGLAASLTIYFNAQYGLDAKTAGFYTAACVFAGSFMRPIGGNLADRIGGIKTLSYVYIIAAFALGVIGLGIESSYAALGVFVLAMLALGAGNGAVFQLVPQRFRKEIGVMTGLVGMAGGIGGFYLASSLGMAKKITGEYRVGFLAFAALAVLGWIGLFSVKRRWRTTWGSAAMTTARV